MNSKAEVIARVKKKLDVRGEDLTELELFQILEKTRNRHHPDNSTNEDTKEIYEQKFKEYSNLLIAFSQVLVSPAHTSNELAIYETTIERQKAEITEYKLQLAALRETIKQFQDTKADEVTENLLQRYEPQKKYWYILGGVALGGFLLKAFLYIGPIADFFETNVPLINQITLSVLTVLLVLVFSGIILRRYLQEKKATDWTKRVRLTYFYRKFYDSEIRAHFFNESEVVNFIHNEFYSRNKFTRFYERSILGLEKETFIEELKEIMILNLLSQDVICKQGNRAYQKVFYFKGK